MAEENPANPQSVLDFKVKDTYGNDVSLDKYKGQVLVVVNIASQCGLTSSNYDKLTKLQEKYKEQRNYHQNKKSKDDFSFFFSLIELICPILAFKILSFPCNQFANEMPEADGEEMVCHLKKANANVGDVFKKVDVNGDNAAPLYKYLKKEQGGFLGDSIKWNFTKFLVDKEGKVVDRFAPTTSPTSIESKIDDLLKK